MILIDDRRGSAEKDILSEFDAQQVPYTVTRLACGDFAFTGWGPPNPDGSPRIATFGFERKVLSDFIQSLESKRLFQQVTAMVGQPGVCGPAFDFPFLVLEAIFKADIWGNLIVPRGHGQWGTPYGMKAFPAEKVENTLTMLTVACGLRIHQTFNAAATAQLVARTWKLFQKQWGEHSTLKNFSVVNLATHASFTDPTMLRLVASQYPGIGWEKSGLIAERYKSVAAFVREAADNPSGLTEVDGIGKRTATAIHQATIFDDYTVKGPGR